MAGSEMVVSITPSSTRMASRTSTMSRDIRALLAISALWRSRVQAFIATAENIVTSTISIVPVTSDSKVAMEHVFFTVHCLAQPRTIYAFRDGGFLKTICKTCRCGRARRAKPALHRTGILNLSSDMLTIAYSDDGQMFL